MTASTSTRRSGSRCRLTLVALAALCTWAASGPSLARARTSRPAWQREVGRRLESRASRRQQRRFALGAIHDAPMSPHAIVAQLEQMAKQPGSGLSLRWLTPKNWSYPVVRVDLPSTGARPVRALINAGTHAEEVQQSIPQALGLLRFALRDKAFRRRYATTVLIKLNPDDPELAKKPWYIRRLTRYRDLNRSYAAGRWMVESRLIARSLRGQKFDVAVDLHADSDLDGFLLVDGRSDAAKANWPVIGRALSALPNVALLDAPRKKPIVTGYALSRLGAGITPFAEHAVGCFDTYLADRGVPYSFTMETPQKLDPRLQVRGGLRLLRSILDNVRVHGGLGRGQR
ncbi:MAG: hypothetical protein KC503_16260 [Myxococcales bacterium]|nr:hypothetical protein [Myxococcales bacterium]